MGSEPTTRALSVLRWFLVLPGALAFDVLVRSPLDWVSQGTLYLGGIAQVSPEDGTGVGRALASFVGLFACVFGGACIAPTKKLAVSILLSLTLIVPCGILLLKAQQLLGPSSAFAVHLRRTLVLDFAGAVAATGAIVFLCRTNCLRASLRRGNHRAVFTCPVNGAETQTYARVRAKWWAILRLILLTAIILILLWFHMVVLRDAYESWSGFLR
jgi:hypothetical protein